jgi:hypothetical protein
MLSQEAELALGRLAEGVAMNPLHTIARELIAAGLAMNDFGHLVLTETGRRLSRRTQGNYRHYEILDQHVSDMSQYQNPMGLGPEVQVKPFWTNTVPVETVTDYTRALRAAGVATGKTGLNVDVKWVHAFMDAWVHDEQK